MTPYIHADPVLTANLANAAPGEMLHLSRNLPQLRRHRRFGEVARQVGEAIIL